VLALYRQAKNAGDLKTNNINEIFFHLAAVSTYRLGHIKEARGYWKESLRINQNFDWARQNMADLDKPPQKRHGPWAFPFESWLLGSTIRNLAQLLDQNKRQKNKAGLQKSTSQFLEKHPQIIFLAPYLIEKGDDKACEFVIRLAVVSEHPELIKAAKSFLTGKRGSLDLRMQCAQMLSEADLLPSGTIRMWSGRDWSDSMMHNFQIDFDPKENQMPKKAEKLNIKALEALNNRDSSQAQAFLEEALNLYPEDPQLLNNLAVAYEMQGLNEEAHKMIYDILARFPDYLFGIAGVARLEISSGNLEKARDLLESLMVRKKMHISEFNALCMGEIELCMAEGKSEGAKTWIDMWERVYPDNPELPRFRSKVGYPREGQ
jgi:tetratricopeptide (TPR) repeat protein